MLWCVLEELFTLRCPQRVSSTRPQCPSAPVSRSTSWPWTDTHFITTPTAGANATFGAVTRLTLCQLFISGLQTNFMVSYVTVLINRSKTFRCPTPQNKTLYDHHEFIHFHFTLLGDMFGSHWFIYCLFNELHCLTYWYSQLLSVLRLNLHYKG
jgi:hypothetical protein